MPKTFLQKAVQNKTAGYKVRMRNIRHRRLMLTKPECRKIVNCVAEKKYFNTNSGVTTPQNTGLCTVITNIPQGDADLTRDGDQVLIRSIEFKWAVLMPQTISADIYNICRCIVFQWLPSDTTPPTPSQILFSTGTAQAVIAPYVHDTRFMFRILYDHTVILTRNSNTATTGMNQNSLYVSKRIRIYPSKMRPKIQYASGGTTATGNVYVLMINNSGSGTTLVPQTEFYAKVNFTDA